MLAILADSFVEPAAKIFCLVGGGDRGAGSKMNITRFTDVKVVAFLMVKGEAHTGPPFFD